MKFKELKKVLMSYDSVELHYTNKLGLYDYIPNYQAGFDTMNKYDEAKVIRVKVSSDTLGYEPKMSVTLRDTTK